MLHALSNFLVKIYYILRGILVRHSLSFRHVLNGKDGLINSQLYVRIVYFSNSNVDLSLWITQYLTRKCVSVYAIFAISCFWKKRSIFQFNSNLKKKLQIKIDLKAFLSLFFFKLLS